MKKNLSFILSLALMIGPLGTTETAWALTSTGPGLPISAPSAVLIDATTQKVIFAKAPHVRRPPASTSKVMTALVILETLSLNQVIRIPKWVGSIEPSKAYLRSGERYRVRDLLHATLISSANDASEVLGVAAAGSRANFAHWMNQRARRIGCRDTNFVNASGLPPGNQYSTAYDLTLIMREARKNSFIVDSLGRKYHAIRSLDGRKISLRNHNRLLWKRSRSVIGKTGYTKKGRYCFVGRIKWGGREVLVSLLGSNRLWKDLSVLVDYQFGAGLVKIYKNRKQWSRAETQKIQAVLSKRGYSPGPIDGQFGPKTIRAIERFQKDRRIHTDGIIGPVTCKKLTEVGLPKNYCR